MSGRGPGVGAGWGPGSGMGPGVGAGWGSGVGAGPKCQPREGVGNPRNVAKQLPFQTPVFTTTVEAQPCRALPCPKQSTRPATALGQPAPGVPTQPSERSDICSLTDCDVWGTWSARFATLFRHQLLGSQLYEEADY